MVAVAVVKQSGDQFSPLDPGGQEFFYWDFTKDLRPGDSITSAVITAKNVVDGSDNSAAMITGASLVLNGNVVRQMVSGASVAAGSRYRLTAFGTTPSGQVIPLSGILPIGPEYGVVT